MVMMVSTQTKPNWADLDEEDGKNLDFLLPPPEVIGPDKNGIKKVISYKYNDEGLNVKITTTSRVTRTVTGQGVMEHRSWQKFGAAVEENGDYTTVSAEEIFLERPTAPGKKLIQQATGCSQIISCTNCGKYHWTAKCPYKNLAPNPSEKYVPPRPDTRRRNDNSIRVSNLSEDTHEADFRELFGNFGSIERAVVIFDQQTGNSQGFGFVSFVHREDAQRAVNMLNGYGYDNLILRVEWASPRPN